MNRQQKRQSQALAYLDHAATSWPKPPAVVAAVTDCMSASGGNPGRGSHKLALAAAREVYACREAAASLFGADPARVIFTLNTTHALNLAIKGLLAGGGHAVCSDMEHNAVYRPLCRLRDDGIITFDAFETTPADPYRHPARIVAALAEKLRPDTKVVVVGHASNICSASLPLEGIGQLCRRRGIAFVVDAAQSAGTATIDMAHMNIDALCVPGHKGLLGPQGCGMLILGERFVREVGRGEGRMLEELWSKHGFDSHPAVPPVLPRLRLATLMEGGNGVDSLSGQMSEELPERYEAGTPPTPAIAGLRAGMEHILRVGVESIRERECRLTARLCEGLSAIAGVTLYAPGHAGAVTLFSVAEMDSEAVAAALDAEGICVRPGFHCAAPGHRTLGTPTGGAVRASVGWCTEERDVDRLLRAVQRIKASL